MSIVQAQQVEKELEPARQGQQLEESDQDYAQAETNSDSASSSRNEVEVGPGLGVLFGKEPSQSRSLGDKG